MWKGYVLSLAFEGLFSLLRNSESGNWADGSVGKVLAV